jgi:hypothetical protein
MGTELQVSRSSRVADLAWSYEIVLDGCKAGVVRNGATRHLPPSAGKRTLQIRSLHIVNRQLGLASPTATFDVHDGERVEFTCHAHSFRRAVPQWLASLRGDRSHWITLARVSPAA